MRDGEGEPKGGRGEPKGGRGEPKGRDAFLILTIISLHYCCRTAWRSRNTDGILRIAVSYLYHKHKTSECPCLYVSNGCCDTTGAVGWLVIDLGKSAQEPVVMLC